ncbi:MAG: diguanylate cyclase domain-containing protein [Motilibacteraceae bacterium]
MSSTRSHEVVDLTSPPLPRTPPSAQRVESTDADPSGPPAWVMTSAFQASPSPMAVVALDGTCLAANGALARLLGRLPEELAGCRYQDLTPEEDLPLDAAATEQLLAAAGQPTGQVDGSSAGQTSSAGDADAGIPVTKRLRHARGHLVWVRVQGALLRDEGGRAWGAVASVTPLDDDGATDLRARWLLRHDPLTGAGNRRLLDETLTALLCPPPRATGPNPWLVAVLFCDVDDFKEVNDAKGHRHGDELLVSVSRRLTAGCRDGDVVARVGGDEFVVVSRVAGAEDAESLAERCRRALSRPYALEGGESAQVRVSVGWAVSTPGCTGAELLDRADLDMYRQKALGRGRTSRPR